MLHRTGAQPKARNRPGLIPDGSTYVSLAATASRYLKALRSAMLGSWSRIQSAMRLCRYRPRKEGGFWLEACGG
jgi:hypothetical protein